MASIVCYGVFLLYLRYMELLFLLWKMLAIGVQVHADYAFHSGETTDCILRLDGVLNSLVLIGQECKLYFLVVGAVAQNLWDVCSSRS